MDFCFVLLDFPRVRGKTERVATSKDDAGVLTVVMLEHVGASGETMWRALVSSVPVRSMRDGRNFFVN